MLHTSVFTHSLHLFCVLFDMCVTALKYVMVFEVSAAHNVPLALRLHLSVTSLWYFRVAYVYNSQAL